MEGGGAGLVPEEGAAALEELERSPPGLLLLVPLMLGLQKVSTVFAPSLCLRFCSHHVVSFTCPSFSTALAKRGDLDCLRCSCMGWGL